MARRRTLAATDIDRHLDRLMRAALALCGDRHDAEDLVQETCLRVLQRPRRLERRDGEAAYLLAALRNTFLNTRRARSRRPVTVALSAEDRGPAALEPDRVAEGREVWSAIAALPPVLRDAVVAVDVAGLAYAEAARLLGAPEATIATRVFRGRARVAEALRAEPQ